MTATYQAYIGSAEISTGLLQLTCTQSGPGAELVTLTAGEYYCAGYTGESTAQLVEHIQAQIRTLAADYADITVTMATATGIVTMDFQGHSTTVDWTDSDLGVALGFGSAQLTGASSYTGTYAMRWFWSPSLQPSRHPVDLDEFWEAYSGTVGLQSPDSTSHTRQGELSYSAQLSYELLTRAEVTREAGGDETDNGRFEQFWIKVAHEGMPVRIVVDRTTYAATTDYRTAFFASEDRESELGGLREWCEPSQGESWHALWDVDTYWIKHTP